MLRSALALSMLTGRSVRIDNVRGKRKRPGLLRQHLTGLRAAAEICGADVKGASMGSGVVSFSPGPVRPGRYEFSVGTAGSATLVLQTVLPALLLAADRSRLVLRGGTHNPMAPTFDFLDRSYLPVLRRMGPNVTARLERSGFYPAGGGVFRVDIEPCEQLAGFELRERGQLRRREVVASVARLPRSIAQRECAVLAQRLGWPPECFRVDELPAEHGPGNVICVDLEFDHVTEVVTGFGQKGVPAETVAHKTSSEVARYVDAGVPVGEHLADQLLLLMAIAGGGAFETLSPTQHMKTQSDVLERFLEVAVRSQKLGNDRWLVAVEPAK